LNFIGIPVEFFIDYNKKSYYSSLSSSTINGRRYFSSSSGSNNDDRSSNNTPRPDNITENNSPRSSDEGYTSDPENGGLDNLIDRPPRNLSDGELLNTIRQTQDLINDSVDPGDESLQQAWITRNAALQREYIDRQKQGSISNAMVEQHSTRNMRVSDVLNDKLAGDRVDSVYSRPAVPEYNLDGNSPKTEPANLPNNLSDATPGKRKLDDSENEVKLSDTKRSKKNDNDSNDGSGGAGGGLGPFGGGGPSNSGGTGPSNSGGTGQVSSNKDISSEFNFYREAQDYVLIISSYLFNILSEIIVNLPSEIWTCLY